MIDEVGQEGLSVFDFVAPEQAKHIGYEARGCLGQLRAKASNKGQENVVSTLDSLKENKLSQGKQNEKTFLAH